MWLCALRLRRISYPAKKFARAANDWLRRYAGINRPSSQFWDSAHIELAWERPEAVIGCQEERIGETVVWVLPNPSGLNAHYQVRDLGRLFSELNFEVNARLLV